MVIKLQKHLQNLELQIKQEILKQILYIKQILKKKIVLQDQKQQDQV